MHVSFFDSWALSGGNLIRVVLLGFFEVWNVYLVDFYVYVRVSLVFFFFSLCFFSFTFSVICLGFARFDVFK